MRRLHIHAEYSSEPPLAAQGILGAFLLMVLSAVAGHVVEREAIAALR
jgi:hypothetical protein